MYLVRHGQTALNAAGVLRGRLDPPLDDVGNREAAALGALFAGVPIDLVVASPLRRAVETATAIAAACGAPVETDILLVDRDYGTFAGQSRGAVEARFGALDDAPGVEPASAVAARALHGLEAIVTKIGSGRAVAVAHDAVNRQLLAELANGPLAASGVDAIPQRTGCWNRLERLDQRWTVQVIDAIPGDGRTP